MLSSRRRSDDKRGQLGDWTRWGEPNQRGNEKRKMIQQLIEDIKVHNRVLILI